MPTELMTEPNALAILREEVRTLTTDELRDQLASQLQLTADHLLRLACVIRELEERGEDLSELRLGLMPHLRRIAYGQIAPEIVVRYAGFPALIQRLASYPLPEQRLIASGQAVPLVVMRGDTTDVRQVDPLHLSRDQMHQVFARDHIRAPEEQVVLLERQRERPKKPHDPRRRVRIDAERCGLRIGRAFAPLEDVLLALAQLRYPDYDETAEGEATLVVKLSAAEHQQLKVRAAKSHASMTTLVRRAIAAAGLIRGIEE